MCVIISINTYEWSMCIIICSPFFITVIRTAQQQKTSEQPYHMGAPNVIVVIVYISLLQNLFFRCFVFIFYFYLFEKYERRGKPVSHTTIWVRSVAQSWFPFIFRLLHVRHIKILALSLSLDNSLVSYIYYVFAAHSHFSPLSLTHPQFECISQT